MTGIGKKLVIANVACYLNEILEITLLAPIGEHFKSAPRLEGPGPQESLPFVLSLSVVVPRSASVLDSQD